MDKMISINEVERLIAAFEAVDKATSDIRMKMPMFADRDNHIRFTLPFDLVQPFSRASADFCQKIEDAKKAIAALRNIAPSPQTAAEPDGVEVSWPDVVSVFRSWQSSGGYIRDHFKAAGFRIIRAAPAAAPVAGDAVMEALNYTKEVLRNLQPLINAAGIPPMALKIGILSKIATAGAHQVKSALPMIDAALASLTPSPKPVAVDAPVVTPAEEEPLTETFRRAMYPLHRELTEKERNKAVSLITATLQGVEGNLCPEDLWRVVASVALAQIEKQFKLVRRS